MKKRNIKRVISVALTVFMLFGMLQLGAFADHNIEVYDNLDFSYEENTAEPLNSMMAMRPGMVTAVPSLPGSVVNNSAMTIIATTSLSEVRFEFEMWQPGTTQSHLTWEAFLDQQLSAPANVTGVGAAARLQLQPGTNVFWLRVTYHESDMIIDTDVFVYQLTITFEEPEVLPRATFMWNFIGAPNYGIFMTVQVGSDGILAVPETPIREGYTFHRWTTDIETQNAFNFSEPLLDDIVLFAQWIIDDPGFDLPPIGATPQEVAEHIVAQMTFEEKMAQIIFPRGANQTTNSAQTLATLERMSFGGKVLFGGDVGNTKDEVVRLTYEQQEATVRGSRFNIPMLITIDNEGGATMRYGANINGFLGTAGPSNMALGATNCADLAFEMGLVLGREVFAGGFNTNLAPTVDVNSNPANPIIAARSPGSCPDLVSRIGAALVKGTQATSGVLATAKHFPGHGNTATDTHHPVLTVVPGTLEEMRALDLPPFKAAIDAGTAMIMTAHVATPYADLAPEGTPPHPVFGRAYMMPTERDTHATQDLTELPRLAAFSYLWNTEIIRNEWGFEGLVTTDGLDMGGITRFYTPRISTYLSVMAGADIALLPATGNNATLNGPIYPTMIQDLKDMAEGRVTEVRRFVPGDTVTAQRGFGTGEVIFEINADEFMARIVESATRIIKVKIQYGIYDPWAGENQPVLRRTLEEAQQFARDNIRTQEHREIERRVSSAAISLQVNEVIQGRPVLPRELNDGDTVFILTSSQAAGRVATLEMAVHDIARREGISVTVHAYTYADGVDNFTQVHRDHIAAADHVLIGSVINNAATRLPTNARAQTVMAIWDYIQANGYANKSAHLALQLPYELGFLRNASAVLHTNGAVNNNVASPLRMEGPVNTQTGRLDTANTGDFPAPVYLSIVEAVFGLVNPTGVSPVDVRDEWHEDPINNLVVRVGEGMTFEDPAPVFSGANPAVLSTALEQGNVILSTAGNLGIFAHHSPFVIPADTTLIVATTLNVSRDAELIVEGTLLVLPGGRINNQGTSTGIGGTITIAPGGTVINYGHVENVSNSVVVNYGTIVNNERFEIRANTRFHDCGVVSGEAQLRIHRDAITSDCRGE